MQTNQIDVKVIDVVCKIIDEVSFAGADSVMHGTIEIKADKAGGYMDEHLQGTVI